MGNPNCEVNHINRNTLDNRKINLDAESNSNNRINTDLRKKILSEIKGVYFRQKDKCYVVEFKYQNKRYYSKGFKTLAEATYMRYLYEQHFIPKYSINNTQKVQELINTLSSMQKKEIQKYFSNRLKNQVVK